MTKLGATMGSAGITRTARIHLRLPRTFGREPVLRAVLLLAILGAFGSAAAGCLQHLVSLVGASDWGSDWRWLEDGLQRLAAGLPLNRPEYVAAPFSQLADGPAYTWSLHPPYNATIVAPILLLTAELRQAAWAWLMAGAILLALWLAWPHRTWWGTSLLLAATILAPTTLGLVDQLHYANPNALVVLGLVLTRFGQRRGSALLIAVGLVLAAVKILPAVALGCWLLATRPSAGANAADPGSRPDARSPSRRGIVLACGTLVALTLPVVAADPGVIGDTIAVQLNLIPWNGPQNLAPAVLAAPAIGSTAALWLSRTMGLALLGVILVRRLDGPGGLVIAAAAPLFLTPQLWSHWFLIPVAAILISAPDWAAFRRLDRWLRTAWTSAGTSPPSAAPPGAAGLAGAAR